MAFVEDWLAALRGVCSEAQLTSFLRRAGLGESARSRPGRITLDEIVRLYQIAAVETGDEMMGLWSRPIRARALQHLLTTVREASSLPSALHRFSTFWNLLLDDWRLEVETGPARLRLSLLPRAEPPPSVQRFGHMLILKLSHGLLSWLAGRELPVAGVAFAFPRPAFAADYPVLFPATADFDAPRSAIAFDPATLGPPVARSAAELVEFLDRAPRDWIFTRSREHSLPLRVRELLHRADGPDGRLPEVAAALGLTPRTLMRRLEADETSFQAIKDGLRRDLAIRALRDGRKSVEEISHDLGFSSAANFHRAFRRWTGAAPSLYRPGKG
ncbi:AraC family transcriptional regulator ligand-binding domain-containing protein [Albimonas sp. CAU 1670]|uniref:AraC family transcriptional regulator n=1 Tax=Albimonas sp. CAU 1670 TaxID=3032599 RepID=UPI0023DB4638|nr:AraC family transcriptional regulator [Albimonas sp. CAU 1670]MDF2234177.1 AraC family transcriptional regulator ligand-binding domain-containing protein [Albimonas sp. CAU 1670]